MLGLFGKNIPAYAEAAQAAGVALENLTWGNYFGNNMLPVTLGNICLLYTSSSTPSP